MMVGITGKIKLFCLFIPLLFIVSCGGNKTGNSSENVELFPAFDDFPDSLFYGINFGQTINETEEELLVLGFELKDSSGSKYFVNKIDSTEFILSDKSDLVSFKVFLYSAHYLSKKQQLLNRFEINSSESSLSEEFSVFYYELDNVDFKLSIFSPHSGPSGQKDYLRLSFEENLSK